MKRVVVTGSLGYDYIMNFPGRFADRIMLDKIHVLSLSFLVDRLTKNIGGCATNLAYTLKLLGGEPLIVSSAGKDFGEMKKFLLRNNISTQGIMVYADDFCSSYHVVTDKDDNQIGAYYVGASKHNKELSLYYEEFATIGPTDPIAMKKFVAQCQKLQVPYLYDPSFQIANFTPNELRKGLAGAAIAIGNDYEIALMEQRLNIAHEKLISMVPILITTLGPKGSIVESGSNAMHIKPAKPSRVLDPTGAGDAYRAGFLAGYLREFDLETCGQMGSVAAAYTVEQYGTVTHHFTIKEFEKRYKENYGEELVISIRHFLAWQGSALSNCPSYESHCI